MRLDILLLLNYLNHSVFDAKIRCGFRPFILTSFLTIFLLVFCFSSDWLFLSWLLIWLVFLGTGTPISFVDLSFSSVKCCCASLICGTFACWHSIFFFSEPFLPKNWLPILSRKKCVEKCLHFVEPGTLYSTPTYRYVLQKPQCFSQVSFPYALLENTGSAQSIPSFFIGMVYRYLQWNLHENKIQ